MKQLVFILLSGFVLGSCSNEPDFKVESAKIVENKIVTEPERLADINKKTAILFSDSLKFNKKAALELLAAYEVYIEFDSFESKSKDIQFKAGELAKALNKPHVAIYHFNDLISRAPKHEKAGLAMFYKAMIIGDILHEDELAKKTYKEFIKNYPDHPFVESAKASINFQGKTLEEVVKEFEKQNS
jgi:tetratricopeptide (TPR) repeat protein